MKESGKSYDFVVRARSDLTYHPKQMLNPCWLNALRPNEVLTVDKEWHQHVRWNEQPETKYPLACEDQFLVGRTDTMQHFFTIDETWKRADCHNGPASPEWIIAATLHAQGVKVHTVELQLQAIKASNWKDLTSGWIASPCASCTRLGCA